jgi:hypothetical protein
LTGNATAGLPGNKKAPKNGAFSVLEGLAPNAAAVEPIPEIPLHVNLLFRQQDRPANERLTLIPKVNKRVIL